MGTISTVAIDLRSIAGPLQIPLVRVERVIELLDAGNTVPFITRYRKDETGGLDEEQIRQIQQRLGKLRLLGRTKTDDPALHRIAGQTDRGAGGRDRGRR